MQSLNELGEVLLQNCPQCGRSTIEITKVEAAHRRRGFLWSGWEQVIRVHYYCPNCDANPWPEGGGFRRLAYESEDFDMGTVSATLQLRAAANKAKRDFFKDLFGLDPF